MELLVLGAGHGVPEPDRFLSSTLLRCGDAYYIIDAGAPVSQLLVRYDVAYSDIRAVFLTHCHGDHIGDVPQLLAFASWYYGNSRFNVYYPDKFVADKVLTYVGEKAVALRKNVLSFSPMRQVSSIKTKTSP